MSTYRRISVLPCSIEQAFAYHERLSTLRRLIPPWRNVRVESATGGIRPGARVVLSMRLGPFTQHWEAEHRQYDPPILFHDVQLSGPFTAWEHFHRFTFLDAQQCELIDEVTYVLPAGALGRALLGNRVAKEIDTMFARRHAVTINDLRSINLFTPHSSPLCIAVTGSSGLVGSALCDFLGAAGHDVIRLVRNPLQATSATVCHWIPQQGIQQLEKVERVDAVVHLAGRSVGESHWTAAEKNRIRQSRVDSTRILATQLSQLTSKLPAFISASAIGYYGDCGKEIVTEASPQGTGFLAAVAQDWELAAQPLLEAGTRVAFARLGVVLWPKAGALAKMLPLFKYCLAGPVGGGQQYWSWISLDDVIYALYKLIVQPECAGAYNLVAPQSVTNAEFTRTVAKVVRRPAILPAPAWALRLALGEMADALLLTSCRAIPVRLANEGYEFVHPSLQSCLRSLLGSRENVQGSP